MIFSKPNIVTASNSRYSGFDWAEKIHKILVVGQGGIGSFVTFYLSRIGHEITTFDFDTFEAHNLGGQLITTDYIGSTKSYSIKSMMHVEFGCTNTIYNNNQRWNKEDIILPIVFSCADSMKVRNDLFETWVSNLSNFPKEEPKCFIDSRMGAVAGEVFCISKGSQIKEYRKTLFDDSEAAELACNTKATTHCAALLSSIAVGLMNNVISNKNVDFEITNVPFHTSFNFNEMIFKTNERFQE